MDPIAAKYIGAGIACIGMGGAGVGANEHGQLALLADEPLNRGAQRAPLGIDELAAVHEVCARLRDRDLELVAGS